MCEYKWTKITFPVQKQIYKSRMDDEFPESLNFTILAQSILCISLLSSQPPFPKRHSWEDKSGKGNYYKTISFDIFLFTTKTEQSHEIYRNTDWFIAVLFKRYRMEHWRKTTPSISSPLRSWLSSAVLGKQMQGFPPELAMFNIGTIKRVTAATHPRPFLQTLNSIITEANCSSPQVHRVWLILSDPLLAAFFIFMAELTSLWDH